MPLHVLVTMPPHPPALDALRGDAGLRLRVVEEPSGGHGVDLLDWPEAWLADAEVLFCSGVMPRNFAAARRVRWVQLGSAGYEGVLEAAPAPTAPAGLRVTNAAGVFDVAIAEWNVGMMIALGRDLRGMLRHQAGGVWDRDVRFQRELRGATVGFWGYGGLARETARLAKAMGLVVHALTRGGVVKPRPHHFRLTGTGDPEGQLPDRVFAMEDKAAFLSSLDFLVVAMPQTPASVGAIGETELRALPRRAYVLNPARGPLIQEDALLRALREGWIAGAALDTHYHYPLPPNHPLWAMPHVILTPHISGSGGTQHFLPRAWGIFTENLKRYRAPGPGGPLLNELSPAQLRGE